MNIVEYNMDGTRYRLTSDLHTHTTFSHGKGSIEDNVAAANEKGIGTIGISDHGYGHILFGLNHRKMKKMRAETERLKGLYPDMEILLGVEANILHSGACIDMTPEEFKDFDYVIAGYHYGATGRNVLLSAGRLARNMVENCTGIGEKKLMRLNTDNMVKAIEENPIRIISHPWHKYAVDILEIAAVCARRGTMIEINNGHLNTLSVEDIRTMALADVKFILTSDAHTPGRVGDFTAGLSMFLKAGVNIERIVNLEAV